MIDLRFISDLTGHHELINHEIRECNDKTFQASVLFLFGISMSSLTRPLRTAEEAPITAIGIAEPISDIVGKMNTVSSCATENPIDHPPNFSQSFHF
jgi:hypothetical protein